MKAIVWTRYGPPEGLQMREVATPSPSENQVLVQVHAAAASTPDAELRRFKLPALFAIALRLYFGVIKPTRKTILGTEFAGEVVAAGRAVTRYHPGDAVYGYTGLDLGTYAEYLCLSETACLALKPTNLPYDEAAALPFGGLEALHTLRKAHLQPGHRVLIVGAGGNIGSYAVQLAKHHGAEVTGVDKAGKEAMLRSIGADHFVDYERADFTQTGQRYDVILDTINRSHFEKTIAVLSENGVYLNANPGLFGELRTRQAVKGSQKRVLRWSGGYTTTNLLALNELVQAGTLRPIIDRRYPLAQVVEAHRYLDTGQKKGNVVLIISP